MHQSRQFNDNSNFQALPTIVYIYILRQNNIGI